MLYTGGQTNSSSVIGGLSRRCKRRRLQRLLLSELLVDNGEQTKEPRMCAWREGGPSSTPAWRAESNQAGAPDGVSSPDDECQRGRLQ